MEEQPFRARSASVDEGLVSGSRGKSRAGLSMGWWSRRWFEPQERAGVGQHVQQSVGTLTHVTDPSGAAGEELEYLLVRHTAVLQLEPPQIETRERAEKHVAAPCREPIAGVDGQA